MKQKCKASFLACEAGQQRQEKITSKDEDGGMLSEEGTGQKGMLGK